MGDLGSIPGWEDPLEESMANHSSIENPYGQRSLVGYNPRDRKESDTTERFHSLSISQLALVGKNLPANV